MSIQQQHSGNHRVVQSTKQVRLLLVDDDLSFCAIARAALSKQGLIVETCSDGRQAISAVKTNKYDAIILDAVMQPIDGFSTCKAIHKLLRQDTPPILISTGLNDEASISKAFESGAVDYVTKPTHWQILGRRVSSLVAQSQDRASAELAEQQVAAVLGDSQDDALVMDSEGVVQQITSNHALNKASNIPLSTGDCLFEKLPENCRYEALNCWHSCLNQREAVSTLLVLRDNEQQKILRLTFTPSLDQFSTHCIISDQTIAITNEQTLAQLSTQCPDTGLSNRSSAKNWLASNRLWLKTDECLAVFRLEILNFRDQEARVGSERFEQSINVFASNLTSSCTMLFEGEHNKSTDYLCARLSSTEFAVCLKTKDSLLELKHKASALIRQLSNKITIDTCSVSFKVRAGIGFQLKDSKPDSELLHMAAAAMQAPPEDAVKLIHVYSHEVKDRLEKQERMEHYLRRDLANRALNMVYQPKVDAQTLTVQGLEALIRWHCEELGHVSPVEFIPLAEKFGLMADLSDFVVSEVLGQLNLWTKVNQTLIPIAINISGSHLESAEFAGHIMDLLEQMNVSPDLIELEVTESIMIDARSCAIQNLSSLRKHGIRISVDDFGTGYSSFSYLRNLPVDVLKIDKSFVDGITEDSKSLAIAKSIITIAHELDLKAVAEGVETAEQLQCLRQLGCDVIQGYFISKPVSPEVFTLQLTTDCRLAS